MAHKLIYNLLMCSMPTREVCEAARAFTLPILVDIIGQAHVVDMFAPQYPDVNFIIPHLGSFADDWVKKKHLTAQGCGFAERALISTDRLLVW